jgi:iron complex transport system substrate-binding protein
MRTEGFHEIEASGKSRHPRKSIAARRRFPNHLCFSAFISGLLALCICASATAEIKLKDDLGRTVELNAPAQRIVTLAPFLTELVFDAGAGARIVGVSAYSDYPPEAARLPQVGTAVHFSLEEIAALKPDLVLVWKDSMRPGDLERIARFGAAVFVARARTLEDVPRLLGVLGRLTGGDASRVASEYARKLEALRRAYAGKRPVSTFLEIWNRPLTTISGRHFINEALEICGARNVFVELPGVAPVVSWEELYRRDPEAIVGMSSATSPEEFRASWTAHAALSAVKAGKLVYVHPDRLQRQTARTPEGIAELCTALDRVR